MGNLRAGLLNQRVSVLQPSEALSAVGQPVKSWLNVGTFWARVVLKGGGESTIGPGSGQQVAAVSDVEVTFRGTGSLTLTVAHRLLWGTRVLGIVAVNTLDDLGRPGVMTVCTCKEMG